MNDMLKVVWDHDPKAVVDAFEAALRTARNENYALRATINSLLNPDNVAAVARQTSKFKAVKLLRDQIPLWSTRDSVDVSLYLRYVEAIWRVRDESAEEAAEAATRIAISELASK